ncbi:DUF536 domain-containing protein [Staphylococcus ureilyticus]|uniref:DUF536 domain-containing protein n=1 Tax=Staphylococcus cohnii species complex TaxID=3239053 RepID=UPI000CFF7301|nr:DUF536 domain-containing protein [Staphylococcus cohnii]
MKTIKMLADELNVTKQTIVNNAKSLNITFEKENGINYINEKDCLKIVNKITKKEDTTKSKISNSKEIFNEDVTKFKNEEDNYSNNSNTLKTKVNELEKQLEIFETRSKNDEKYIKNLTKQLDQQNSNVNTLNKLLENQQILALESNKKIQKLENQLEEERQLNYSFDTSANERQNVNVQEATFTRESKDTDQQQEWEQPTEAQRKDIPEEKEDENINEEPSTIDDKQFEEIDSEYEEREEKPPKKGFWSRLFGN